MDFTSTVGRLVQGSVFEPQTKDMEGRPLTDRNGNPRVQYFIAVAFPKTDPWCQEMTQKLQTVAVAGFPGGESQRADFAWKYIDGDDPKHAGKTGFSGHYVFRMVSGYPIKAYTAGGAEQIVGPNAIKRGYYIQVYGNIAANKSASKPGMFINVSMVAMCGYGEEIHSGPDASAVFAGAPAALPAGASVTPVAGPPLAQAAPGAVAQQGFTPPPAAQAAPPAAPGVQPHPGFLNPPAPPTPPAPAAPQMTEKAAGATYEQFTAQGWTDDQLRAQGYMV